MILPNISPNVAAAVHMVVVPCTLKSSSTGPNATAVPCPPTIGIEPVHIPISELSPRSFESPTATRFCVNISTITSPRNITIDFPPFLSTLRLA